MKNTLLNFYAVLALLLVMVITGYGQTYPQSASNNVVYYEKSGSSTVISPSTQSINGSCTTNQDVYTYHLSNGSPNVSTSSPVGLTTLNYQYDRKTYNAGCTFTNATDQNYPGNPTFSYRVVDFSAPFVGSRNIMQDPGAGPFDLNQWMTDQSYLPTTWSISPSTYSSILTGSMIDVNQVVMNAATPTISIVVTATRNFENGTASVPISFVILRGPTVANGYSLSALPDQCISSAFNPNTLITGPVVCCTNPYTVGTTAACVSVNGGAFSCFSGGSLPSVAANQYAAGTTLTYKVKYTNSTNPYFVSATVIKTITIGATIAASTSNPVNVCISGTNNSLDLNTTNPLPSGGTWSMSATAGATLVGSVFTASGSGTGTFPVTYTKNGCSAIKNVVINALPNITSTFTSVNKCFNSGATILATDYGIGSSTLGGVWSSSNALITARLNGATGVLNVDGSLGSPSVDTSYPLLYTYTNTVGCVSTKSFTVVVGAVPPDPTTPLATVKRCGVGTVNLQMTAVAGYNYKWYSVPTGGTAISGATAATYAPSIASGSTTDFYGELQTTTTGCPSLNRVKVTAVSETFTPYAGPDITGSAAVCQDGAAFTLTGATPVGGTYSGTGVAGGVFTPSSTSAAGGTYTITYAVTQGVCSLSATRSIQVKPLPVISTSVNTGVVCFNSGSYDLVTLFSATPIASGSTTIDWSSSNVSIDNRIAGNILALDNSIGNAATNTNFPLTLTVTTNGCISTKSLTLTVAGIPAAPVVPFADLAGCATTVGGTKAVSMAATGVTGITMKWYTVATNGSAVATGNTYTPTLAVGSYTFFVEAQTSVPCPSLTRTPVNVVVSDMPAQPVVANALVCTTPGSATLAVTNSAINHQYNWYNASSGGSPIAGIPAPGSTFTTPSLSANKTYYVDATNNATGCNNPTRKSVIVTLSTSPLLPAVADILKCDGAGTVALSITNFDAAATYTWYDAEVGGNIIYGPNANAVYSATYAFSKDMWVEGTYGNGCTQGRKKVSVKISSTPGIPAASNVNLCSGPGNAALSVTTPSGTLIYKWFTTSVGGVEVATGASVSINTAATMSYFVEAQTAEGCASPARKQVDVSVTSTLTKPSVDGKLVCTGPTDVTLLVKTPSSTSDYRWYNAPSGGTLLAIGTTLFLPSATTQSVYVDASEGTCTTERTKVDVVVGTAPPKPDVEDKLICSGQTATTLTVNNVVAGNTYKWYSDPILTQEVWATFNFTTPVLTTTTKYYVLGSTPEGCKSSVETVEVKISDAPVSPEVDPKTRCGSGTIDLAVKNLTTGHTYQWFDEAAAFTQLGSDPIFSPNVTVTRSYFVQAKNANGCKTPLKEIVVTVNQLPAAPTINDAVVCQAGSDVNLTPTSSLINAKFNIYDETGLNVASETTTGLLLADFKVNTFYNVTTVDPVTGCESIKKKVNLTLFPEVKFGSDLIFCSSNTGNVDLNLSASPGGGVFSGDGITGSIFNGKNLALNKTYPISYTYTLGGCSKTLIKNITIGFDLQVTVSNKTPEVGDEVIFTPSVTNGTSYSWDFGDNWTSTDKTPSHFYYKTGDQDVKLTIKTDDCSSTFFFDNLVTVDAFNIVTGDIEAFGDSFKVVQNPIGSRIDLSYKGKNAAVSVKLQASDGRLAAQNEVNITEGVNTLFDEVQVQALAQGLYILRITQDGKTTNIKLIKK